MKCACCSSASGIVGGLGILVLIVAIILRVVMGQGIHLFGFQTCASHIVLGANTLLLLALVIRVHEKTPDKQ